MKKRKMKKWQKNGDKKRLHIKKIIIDRSNMAKEVHNLSNDLIRDFRMKTFSILDSVNLNQSRYEAQKELHEARETINQLIDDFYLHTDKFIEKYKSWQV